MYDVWFVGESQRKIWRKKLLSYACILIYDDNIC